MKFLIEGRFSYKMELNGSWIIVQISKFEAII